LSFRFLYQRVPVKERICSYYLCQKPILRNIAQTPDGRLWHYGCLNTAKDEQHKCLECFGTFDGTEAILSEHEQDRGDTFSMEMKLSCPYCGAEVSKHKQFLEEENLAES
jgi:hypothetical protein